MTPVQEERIVVALEAIAAALQPRPPQPMPGSCPLCGAPEAKQVDASTMGAPNQKKCLTCQQVYAA